MAARGWLQAAFAAQSASCWPPISARRSWPTGEQAPPTPSTSVWRDGSSPTAQSGPRSGMPQPCLYGCGIRAAIQVRRLCSHRQGIQKCLLAIHMTPSHSPRVVAEPKNCFHDGAPWLDWQPTERRRPYLNFIADPCQPSAGGATGAAPAPPRATSGARGECRPVRSVRWPSSDLAIMIVGRGKSGSLALHPTCALAAAHADRPRPPR